jgi:hypothetical protein
VFTYVCVCMSRGLHISYLIRRAHARDEREWELEREFRVSQEFKTGTD